GSCPSVTGGRYGNALDLNGSSYLRSPADPNETQYAVSLWFKTSTSTGPLVAVDVAQGIQVYLTSGHACADLPTSGAANTICSDNATYADNLWHHVVHTFGGNAGGQKLYVDGAQVAGSDAASTPANTAGIFIGHQPSGASCTGLIDDVRLYDVGLTAAEVRGLFARPVLDMKFDSRSSFNSGYSYGDSSGFGNTGGCTDWQHCPGTASGVLGEAAMFDGSNKYISLASNASLDLSEGHFSIAAWIKPDTMNDNWACCGDCVVEGINLWCNSWQPEGILGWHSGSDDAWAALQRQVVADSDLFNHNRLRFGFGTADGWSGYYESPWDVIQDNTWNHVALTFGDGMIRLYVNGELRDANDAVFAGKTPGAAQMFDIGRSDDRGTVTLKNVWVTGSELWGSNSEICMTCNGVEAFNRSMGHGDQYAPDYGCDFTDTLSLKVWENDDNPMCGSAPNGGDYVFPTKTWRISDGGTPTDCPYDNSNGSGLPHVDFGARANEPTDNNLGIQVDYVYEHDSLPFRGVVDELQVFRQVLDATAVKGLYDSLNLALHLELDEPPGESHFHDTSGNARHGGCTGASCPLTGVTGRTFGQAPLFTAAEHDRIALTSFGDFGTTTVSAWVYRTESTTARESIVSYKEDQGCGFTLALNEDGASHFPEFRVSVDNAGSAAWQTVQHA
ncbi:MAG TPA: LamG domain-containing protein, partial [Anaerolineae bacterium]|nr:LamG domain-containing protein [Anaerolineae bacterium]